MRPQSVPWITLWTAEVVPVEKVWLQPGLNGVRYLDQTAKDSYLGVLWHREFDRQGEGNPLWREVHARRQRESMLEPRCQVCGKQLPKERIPWLFPRLEYDDLKSAPEPITTTAPTCEECWPDAETRCPHLRAGAAVRAHVEKRWAWGIRGGIYHPAIRRPRVSVSFRDERIPHVIAKKLVVQLDGIREE